MTPERLREIERLFHEARERPPAERDAFLARACADDPTLRREVESLLAQPPAGVIDAPVGALVAGLVAPAACSRPGRRLGVFEVQDCWPSAVWARCIARVTRVWAVRSRSRSCRAPSRRSGPAGPLRAGSARARLAQPSAHRRDLRARRAADAPGAGDGVRRRRDGAADRVRGDSRSSRRCRSRDRSPRRSKPRTRRESFTAI